MKLLVVGDLHLRTRTPKRRTEPDFTAVCLGKLRQIKRIAEDADLVVQVGDFFDSPDPSKALIAAVIEELNRGEYRDDEYTKWFCVHGQHDLQYHSDAARHRSALRVLEAARAVNLQAEDGLSGILPGLRVYGASFGQEPPVPELEPGCFNVLAAHAMVGDRPLWPGHDLTGPEEYARKHPGYDLCALGDYHYPYSTPVGDAWVVNAGCVLRLTADERDRVRRPKVVMFDTERREPTDIYLEASPEAEAFDLVGYEKDQAAQQARESFAAMADAMKGRGVLGVDFKENLLRTFDEMKTPEPVREKVWACWDGL